MSDNNWHNIALPSFGSDFGTGLNDTFNNINVDLEILKRMFNVFRLNPDNMHFLTIDLDWEYDPGNLLTPGIIDDIPTPVNPLSLDIPGYIDVNNVYYQEFLKLIGVEDHSQHHTASKDEYSAIISYIKQSIKNTNTEYSGFDGNPISSGSKWGTIVTCVSINEDYDESKLTYLTAINIKPIKLINSHINIVYTLPYIIYISESTIPILIGNGVIDSTESDLISQALTFGESNSFPTISDGCWVINGVKTDIKVQGENGAAGKSVGVYHADDIDVDKYACVNGQVVTIPERQNEVCLVTLASNKAIFYVTQFDEQGQLPCEDDCIIEPFWLYTWLENDALDLEWSGGDGSWYTTSGDTFTLTAGTLISWLNAPSDISSNNEIKSVFVGIRGVVWRKSEWDEQNLAYGYVYDEHNSNWKYLKFKKPVNSWLIENLSNKNSGHRFINAEQRLNWINFGVCPEDKFYFNISDDVNISLTDLSVWTGEYDDVTQPTGHTYNGSVYPYTRLTALELLWAYIMGKYAGSTDGGDSIKFLKYDETNNQWINMAWAPVSMTNNKAVKLQAACTSRDQSSSSDPWVVPLNIDIVGEDISIRGIITLNISSYKSFYSSALPLPEPNSTLIYSTARYSSDPERVDLELPKSWAIDSNYIPAAKITGMDVVFEKNDETIRKRIYTQDGVIKTQNLITFHKTPQVSLATQISSSEIDDFYYSFGVMAEPNVYLKYYFKSDEESGLIKTAYTDQSGYTRLASDIKGYTDLFAWNIGQNPNQNDDSLQNSTPLIYSETRRIYASTNYLNMGVRDQVRVFWGNLETTGEQYIEWELLPYDSDTEYSGDLRAGFQADNINYTSGAISLYDEYNVYNPEYIDMFLSYNNNTPNSPEQARLKLSCGNFSYVVTIRANNTKSISLAEVNNSLYAVFKQSGGDDYSLLTDQSNLSVYSNVEFDNFVEDEEIEVYFETTGNTSSVDTGLNLKINNIDYGTPTATHHPQSYQITTSKKDIATVKISWDVLSTVSSADIVDIIGGSYRLKINGGGVTKYINISTNINKIDNNCQLVLFHRDLYFNNSQTINDAYLNSIYNINCSRQSHFNLCRTKDAIKNDREGFKSQKDPVGLIFKRDCRNGTEWLSFNIFAAIESTSSGETISNYISNTYPRGIKVEIVDVMCQKDGQQDWDPYNNTVYKGTYSSYQSGFGFNTNHNGPGNSSTVGEIKVGTNAITGFNSDNPLTLWIDWPRMMNAPDFNGNKVMKKLWGDYVYWKFKLKFTKYYNDQWVNLNSGELKGLTLTDGKTKDFYVRIGVNSTWDLTSKKELKSLYANNYVPL